MIGGGGDNSTQPSPPSANGGEFLLQLLRNPTPQPPPPPQPPAAQILSHDPAVAAVGPTLPYPPFPSNGHDIRPPFAPHNFFPQGFLQNPNPNLNPNHSWSEFNRNHQQNFQFNPQSLADDIKQKLGFLGPTPRPDLTHQHEQNLMFGSLPCKIQSQESAKARETVDGNRPSNFDYNRNSPSFNQNPGENSRNFQNRERERKDSGSGGWGRHQQIGPSQGVRHPPPGFPSKPSSYGNWDSGNRSFENNVDKKGKSGFGEVSHRGPRGAISNHEDEREKGLLPEHGRNRGDTRVLVGHGKNRGDTRVFERRLSSQLDSPGPPGGSSLHSVSASDIEESLTVLHCEVEENGVKPGYRLRDDMRRGGGGPVGSVLDGRLDEEFGSLVLEDGSDEKNNRKGHRSFREKDRRSDTRGKRLLNQKGRNFKSRTACRNDINRLNAPFLAIYESLIPPEEEKGKQKQLMKLLEKLVSKEWPEAHLYLYGSCANSFGVSKSDVDVCMTLEDPDVNKPEVLLKLAEILESDNLQNVQALTRARVPIVKLMDPATGISCDICINNVLAVVNTKLLRDYAKIDVRLRQLVFIVKHWAKSRGVNETYQGTLSSYAYVLMCIHFLQQRQPAILPCLQGMERTYAVTVDDIECAYFDQVDELSGFGSRNRESIAQLVWAFFNYWAYCHDYANNVISIRTGSIISKRAKDWTRRVGNDRHLICIEDPFETSHDLGRVVDRNSIGVLREEFERAAEIMQHDPNPCVTLFEPYVSMSS
ncbi:hypothetical protein RHSIM_Rhsim07G0023700 [Rhododendron simsii]|uniref:RNA uridylyltransferase n=1 Tax=Rhododendron simsii TaxID=118357 RepID=A0A834GR57_RHOSS|nr:hypothetical protein RHSIM_Rhsim07G0023700 [Rhododendron simsii]